MSTLSTQVPPGGTQIPEYSMWYCLSTYIPSGKRPWITQIPLHVTHSPLCKACPHTFRGRQRNLGQQDRDRASYMGVGSTQARGTAQHSKWGGSHPLPLGSSPMQGVNQYGHLAHTALQFFILVGGKLLLLQPLLLL